MSGGVEWYGDGDLYHCGTDAGGTLREAQIAKLDAMLAAAEVCATDHVLEIGCGWGSMAIRAVQSTGCRYWIHTGTVTGLQLPSLCLLTGGSPLDLIVSHLPHVLRVTWLPISSAETRHRYFVFTG